jgi:hypothetical protein
MRLMNLSTHEERCRNPTLTMMHQIEIQIEIEPPRHGLHLKKVQGSQAEDRSAIEPPWSCYALQQMLP